MTTTIQKIGIAIKNVLGHNTEPIDIDSIPPMRYLEGEKVPVIRPYVQLGRKNSSRLIYRGR